MFYIQVTKDYNPFKYNDNENGVTTLKENNLMLL